MSPNGGADLCKCESGSGASLGATIVKSDRMFRHPAMVRCSEANCCVLSKSDFCFAQLQSFLVDGLFFGLTLGEMGRRLLRMVSVHGGDPRIKSGDNVSSERRAFGGCLGTRRR